MSKFFRLVKLHKPPNYGQKQKKSEILTVPFNFKYWSFK